MNINIKALIVITLVISCAAVSFSLPKAVYKGTDFLSTLVIPTSIPNWQGIDISDQLNIQSGEGIYNFISDIHAYQFTNSQGEKLIFIILDAGNFHHPKGCFTMSGYEILEMRDTTFSISEEHTLKTHTLFTTKENENSLSFYWITIDKNIAHEWIEQKLKQLFFSFFFNRKRVGLMIRIDIPSSRENIGKSKLIAKNFVSELHSVINTEQSEYIFGKF